MDRVSSAIVDHSNPYSSAIFIFCLLHLLCNLLSAATTTTTTTTTITITTTIMHPKQLLAFASLLSASITAAAPAPAAEPGPFTHADEWKPGVWYPVARYNHTLALELAKRQIGLYNVYAYSGNACTGTAHFMGGYAPACIAVPAPKRSLSYSSGK